MGPLAPVTTKVLERMSQQGADGVQFRMGVSAMTGWRGDMEDAHAVRSDMGASLFGVFDGHGGSACSEFLRTRLPQEMCRKMDDGEIQDTALRLDSEYLKSCPTSAQFTGSTSALFVATCRDPDDGADGEGDAAVSPCIAATPPSHSLPTHLNPAAALPPRATPARHTGDAHTYVHPSFPTSLSSSEGDKMPTSSNSSSSAAHTTPSYSSTPLETTRRQFDLTAINVGDSRVVLGCVDKATNHLRIHSLTRDHRPSDDDERERILAAHGSVYNDRVNGDLALSRAFGNGRYKKGGQSPLWHQVVAVPDVTHAVCQTGDIVVVCCDGVFENGCFTDDSLLEYVHAQLMLHDDPAQAAAAVCDAAIERGSHDNVTCMVVILGESDSYLEHSKVVCPGPVSHPSSQRFMHAYNAAAMAGGLTSAECCERRVAQLERLADREEHNHEEWQAWRARMPQDVQELPHGDAKRIRWFEEWLAAQAAETTSSSSEDDHFTYNYTGLSYPRIHMTSEEHLNLGVARNEVKSKSWCELLEVLEAEVSPDTETLSPSSPSGPASRFNPSSPHTPPPAFYVNNSYTFDVNSDSDSEDGLNMCVKG